MKKILLIAILIINATLLVPQFSFASEPTSTTADTQVTTEAGSQVTAEPTEDESIVGMFGLNWKLFLGQLINFGIVLFVLWKWVWKPVTSNMEARTQRIKDSLKNADQIEKDKSEFAAWRTEEMSQARQEASEIISTAKQQAETVKTEILDKAKAEQQNMLERNQQELAQQKTKMLQEAQGELAGLVVAASEKLLRSKLDSKTDQKLINQALKDL